MWILSDKGFIHSGRIIAVRPPEYKNSKTMRVEVDKIGQVYVLRELAEGILGISEKSILASACQLQEAIYHDMVEWGIATKDQPVKVRDKT